MKILFTFLAALALFGGGLMAAKQDQKLGAFNPTGGSTYYLQASINSSQTTITLTSFTEPSSGIPYTMSYLNTDILYGTINPTSANSEFISFTGITQNSNGTALLTGVTRGLGRSYPYVASTTLAHSTPGQTQFILSAPPEFYNEYAAKRNSQVISGQWQFTTLPTSTVGCSSNDQFCNKAYIDGSLSQGAATSSFSNMGLVQLATFIQMASSTASSTTAKPLVVSTKFTTTTPGTQCTGGMWNCIPVGNLAGKISQLWLDLSQAFTWAGAHIFNSTATFNATTTIAASNPLSNAFLLNGIPYAFPSAQGASSTVLATNGSGQLIWAKPIPLHYSVAINIGTVPFPTAGGYGTSSQIMSIPANTLSASSTIRLTSPVNCGTNVAGSGTCTWYLRTTAGATLASCATGVGAASSNSVGVITFDVFNNGATNIQNGLATCITTTYTGGSFAAVSGGSTFLTSAIDTSQQLNLVMVLQSSTNAGANVDGGYIITVNP